LGLCLLFSQGRLEQKNVEKVSNGIATAAQAVAIAKGIYNAGRVATQVGRAVIPFFL